MLRAGVVLVAMTKDETKAFVSKHAAQLAEHFEAVRIFVSWSSDDGESTRTYDTGCGNWFAQYGHIRNWLLAEEEEARQAGRDSAKDI